MNAIAALSRRLSELSIPLVIGLVAAVIAANAAPDLYRESLKATLGGVVVAGHPVTFSFLVNDVFMTLFFGLATADVVRALRPGGALDPLRRALNPVLASIGGIVSPAAVYLILVHWLFPQAEDHDLLMGAGAVPTVIPGALIWAALLGTPVHPSLALIPVVPLLGDRDAAELESVLKPVVGMGLFFFGFANAGVELGDASFVTWIVLASLLAGKTLGIAGASIAADRWLGLQLPAGMTPRDVVAAGALASIGLTVALFVAGEAFPADSPYQASARLGALLSVIVAVVAIGWAHLRRGLRPREQ